MIPKKPVPDLIRDGNRFSDKIMRRQSQVAGLSAASFTT
jgi:hypothetical protein